MKEVQKEISQHVTVYEAIDGTEFTSKEQCKKYEESAKCVLMAKYTKLVVKSCSEYDLLHTGSEDDTVNIVKLNNESDINTILLLIALHCPNAAKNTEWLQEREKRLVDAYNTNSLIVIGRGYEEDCFYISFTFNEIIKNLTKISNEVN